MKTVAIKIGSSVILTGRNKLDEFRIAHIADQVAMLRKKEINVVLIVSGAVACGAGYIDFSNKDLKLRKIAAGIGQAYLISIIRKYFEAKNLTIAQILITKNCFQDETNKQSLQEILSYYFQLGIVPIINENDVIDLNSFGGNDNLVAEIATMLHVDQVLMLSRMAESSHGVGGGKIKLQVTENLNKRGIKTSIVDGKEKNIILQSTL